MSRHRRGDSMGFSISSQSGRRSVEYAHLRADREGAADGVDAASGDRDRLIGNRRVAEPVDDAHVGQREGEHLPSKRRCEWKDPASEVAAVEGQWAPSGGVAAESELDDLPD